MEIKERPILFNTEMVRAILDDHKTQTRRVVKPQPEWKENESVPGHFSTFFHGWNLEHPLMNPVENIFKYGPYGKPGGRLYVRESVRLGPDGIEFPAGPGGCIQRLRDYDTFSNEQDEWLQNYRLRRAGEVVTVPSIHMPRWLSRINLEIVNLRFERLQSISIKDILAEGIKQRFPNVNDQFTPWILRGQFIELWDSVATKKDLTWYENPWVWVVEFKRLQG